MVSTIKRRFSGMRITSLVGLLILFFLTYALSGCPQIFNVPMILFIFGTTFFMLLGTFGKDYLKFIPDSLLTLVSIPSEPMPRYADICRFGCRYTVAAATIATILYFITMLQNLADPSSIGMGVSFAIVPTLYALILSEVFFALLYKAYSEGNEIHSTPPLSHKTIATVWVVFFLVMLLLSILLISFAPY